MDSKIAVTPQFARDFALCAAFYKCTSAEILTMKAEARSHYSDAEITFRAMAAKIEGGAK